GSITSITIEDYKDDNQFFNKAKTSIINDIIEKQSIDVSTVSGATFSSRGIIEAVANALGVSYDNQNSQNNNSQEGIDGGFGQRGGHQRRH
ncbi:MAG: FMN-binding protein, partial [Lachnospiraceae bacterium]|nr:FMN-binding protein [Lachnospiraceae bacterium]